MSPGLTIDTDGACLTFACAFLGKYLARMASMWVWMYSSQSSSGASHTIFMSMASFGATRLCSRTASCWKEGRVFDPDMREECNYETAIQVCNSC